MSEKKIRPGEMVEIRAIGKVIQVVEEEGGLTYKIRLEKKDNYNFPQWVTLDACHVETEIKGPWRGEKDAHAMAEEAQSA